jgi:hypothetical protein
MTSALCVQHQSRGDFGLRYTLSTGTGRRPVLSASTFWWLPYRPQSVAAVCLEVQSTASPVSYQPVTQLMMATHIINVSNSKGSSVLHFQEEFEKALKDQ